MGSKNAPALSEPNGTIASGPPSNGIGPPTAPLAAPLPDHDACSPTTTPDDGRYDGRFTIIAPFAFPFAVPIAPSCFVKCSLSLSNSAIKPFLFFNPVRVHSKSSPPSISAFCASICFPIF